MQHLPPPNTSRFQVPYKIFFARVFVCSLHLHFHPFLLFAAEQNGQTWKMAYLAARAEFVRSANVPQKGDQPSNIDIHLQVRRDDVSSCSPLRWQWVGMLLYPRRCSLPNSNVSDAVFELQKLQKQEQIALAGLAEDRQHSRRFQISLWKEVRRGLGLSDCAAIRHCLACPAGAPHPPVTPLTPNPP